MSKTEAEELTASERFVWKVKLGTKRGGVWSYAEWKWTTLPSIM